MESSANRYVYVCRMRPLTPCRSRARSTPSRWTSAPGWAWCWVTSSPPSRPSTAPPSSCRRGEGGRAAAGPGAVLGLGGAAWGGGWGANVHSCSWQMVWRAGCLYSVSGGAALARTACVLVPVVVCCMVVAASNGEEGLYTRLLQARGGGSMGRPQACGAGARQPFIHHHPARAGRCTCQGGGHAPLSAPVWHSVCAPPASRAHRRIRPPCRRP